MSEQEESGTVERVRLDGKVALVTGASRGVGAETARLLAERGADVVVNYRSKERRAREVAEAVEGAGRVALLVQTDIAGDDLAAR